MPSPRLTGTITAPPSKSYTHRAVIMGALANGITTIREPLIGSDTLASIRAMRALGAEILEEGKKLTIKGIKEFKLPVDVIDVENSGTTIRFVTALTAHAPGTVKLTGDASIQKRPMGPLLEALVQLGIECESEPNDGTPPIIVKGGKVKGGNITIPGNISSQFISGLLISTPLAGSDVTIQLTTPPKSSPYLEITSHMLEQFGIKHSYDRTHRVYQIPGQQRYTPIDFTIPGDFSSAAFFLAASSILDADISISNLNVDDPQGDKEILEILRGIGAKISINPQEKIVNVK